jgi:hypothetical protein
LQEVCCRNLKNTINAMNAIMNDRMNKSCPACNGCMV